VGSLPGSWKHAASTFLSWVTKVTSETWDSGDQAGRIVLVREQHDLPTSIASPEKGPWVLSDTLQFAGFVVLGFDQVGKFVSIGFAMGGSSSLLFDLNVVLSHSAVLGHHSSRIGRECDALA
jgi:hypothetical protein